MGFELGDIVPWGRSLDEYRSMFALHDEDLEGRIIDSGGGPSSFTAEATSHGSRVIAADPIYAFEPDAIRRRIVETFDIVMEQNRRNVDDFVWTRYRSVEELGEARMAAMERFLDDYARVRDDGRYVAAELPDLPFPDGAFDLALCSHFLFLYSEQRSAWFHLASIVEMLRVADEARIFPLVELSNAPSRHLEAVVGGLEAGGAICTVERVDYEFQRGGNRMLRVVRA